MGEMGVIESLRARQPGSPLGRVAWWYFIHAVCFTWLVTCYRFRAWGLHNLPRRGPVLLLSNHQSYLDPIAIGVACHYRQCHAMARSTLFRNPVFGGLIRSMNATPIERGQADLAAIRRCIEVLRQGHALLLFPEGTRTPDGTTKPFASGTTLLIKRAMPQVVPVAVEGAYDVWPKGRAMRLTGQISIALGKPIQPQELLDMKGDAGLERVRSEIEAMRLSLVDRHRRGLSS